MKRNLANALILAGADLGADHALGGSGTDVDTFVAGLDPSDGIFHDANDTVIGGAASQIASLIVKDQVDASSYFAAGLFKKKPKIVGQTINPTIDPRFLVS